MRLDSFRRNLLANFAGFGWIAIVQFACVPFYIHFLGVEAYGLVGFYLTLQAALLVLDLGLSPTINREMARYTALPGPALELRDLARTLEAGSWVIGVAMGSFIILLAPLIAERWINAESTSTDIVSSAIVYMGVLLAIQWPLNVYQGGLLGLQRQVRLNAVRILSATLSGGGSIVALWAWSPDLQTFFVWQILVAILQVIAMAWSFWAALPDAQRRAHIELRLLRPAAGFATGMSGIAFFGMVLVQMDKVVLSKLLPLGDFAYYVIAATVASGLHLFVAPLYAAIFPRLSALVAINDEREIRRLYHEATQMLTVMVVPVAAVLTLFPLEVIRAWTTDAAIAAHVAPIVGLLAVGVAINGLMHMPFALQLAYGWTSIGLALTIGQVIVFLPLLVWAAVRFGGVGAACVWALLNAAYMSLGLPWTHRRLLRGDASRWLVSDVCRPAAAAVLVALIGRLLVKESSSSIHTLLAVGAVLAASGFAAFMLSPLAVQAAGRLRLQRSKGRLP